VIKNDLKVADEEDEGNDKKLIKNLVSDDDQSRSGDEADENEAQAIPEE